jgi:tetrahydromethanopterin S-methyltransferase subunit B
MLTLLYRRLAIYAVCLGVLAYKGMIFGVVLGLAFGLLDILIVHSYVKSHGDVSPWRDDGY